MSNSNKVRRDSSNRHKNPKVIGPGIWHCIRVMSLYATNSRTKQEFISFVKRICNTFPCDTCKSHFNKFINENPIEARFNEQSLVSWYNDLHNSVNRKLGKDEFGIEHVYYLHNVDNGRGNSGNNVNYSSQSNYETSAIRKDKRKRKNYDDSSEESNDNYICESCLNKRQNNPLFRQN